MAVSFGFGILRKEIHQCPLNAMTIPAMLYPVPVPRKLLLKAQPSGVSTPAVCRLMKDIPSHQLTWNLTFREVLVWTIFLLKGPRASGSMFMCGRVNDLHLGHVERITVLREAFWDRCEGDPGV